jgi:hypothetical protein
MILEACKLYDTHHSPSLLVLKDVCSIMILIRFNLFVAGIAEVGVMMVRTTLLTLVMFVFSFPLIFGSVQLIYMSSI